MRFSIITPTHDAKYLGELYGSLCAQSFTDWEWIILLNGRALIEDFPAAIINDSRAKIYDDHSENAKIGYLKNRAFNLANGEILVEVDHDDMLTPDCLEKLDIAFQNKRVGFVYSNNAKLAENFIPYNPEFGWVKSEFNGMTAMESFAPSAASFSFIWYAPDHVRAWRATTYKELDGHNVEMEVCDDHELLIRTYLHAPIVHINECLYIYRITGENTWLKKNALVQETTKKIFMQYAQQLAERDAELNNLLKIDLGGGLNRRDGYLAFDQEIEHEDYGEICDLNEGIPIDDNSVGVINASHIIEHLHDKQKTISEIWRVLADGGWAFIDVPSTDGRGAWMDPTHVSFWNQNSFLYYTQKDQAQFIRNDKIKFQAFYLDTIYPGPWWEANKIPVTRAWLRAVKSDTRRPHGIYI